MPKKRQSLFFTVIFMFMIKLFLFFRVWIFEKS